MTFDLVERVFSFWAVDLDLCDAAGRLFLPNLQDLDPLTSSTGFFRLFSQISPA